MTTGRMALLHAEEHTPTMTDNESAGATPAVADATSTQTTGTEQDAQPAATDATLGDAGKRALEAERKTARDAQRRAEAAEKELQALKDAALSESEKRENRLAELEAERASWMTERQDIVLRSTIEREAAKAGADPELVLGSLLLNRDAITFADGTPTNVPELVAGLVKSKPGLVGRPAGSADLGTGTGGRSAAGQTFSRDQLRDPVFFAANRDDILAAQRAGRITDH